MNKEQTFIIRIQASDKIDIEQMLEDAINEEKHFIDYTFLPIELPKFGEEK